MVQDSGTRPAAPAVLDDNPPAPVRADQVAAAVKHCILIVDDNPDSADSLAMLLRLAGHVVRTTHDGGKALALAETYQPHLVLLDIGLPDMDGYEVARRLRAQPCISATTLVALTGYSGEEDRQRALAAGFDHYMVKPLELDTLHGLLALIKGESVPSAACSTTPRVG